MLPGRSGRCIGTRAQDNEGRDNEGQDAAARHREFDGGRAVLVSPGASHAVRDDGDRELWLVAISSETCEPAESVTRKVV